MKIKIKALSGSCITVDVNDASSISWLSINHCDGNQVAAGFPPRALAGEAIISDVINDGELLRILPEKLQVDNHHEEDEERKLRKERKRRKREARRAAKAMIEETKNDTEFLQFKDSTENITRYDSVAMPVSSGNNFDYPPIDTSAYDWDREFDETQFKREKPVESKISNIQFLFKVLTLSYSYMPD